MSSDFDLVIRGGRIFDGLGGDAVPGDVAITGDVIAAVGDISGSGREEIDAGGQIVTPGFVDIHTHYDGQVIWEDRLVPSSLHGVTTVVMGNCGVGFAPCRPQDRERLVKLMEGVEDIPGVVMTEGLSWDWETYPQYLDAVESRPHDINIASYLPHSPLRVVVMGERAAAGEAATPADRARMAEITREAMAAGALGFSTSRSLFHRSSDGGLVPTLDSGEDELLEIARAVQESGDGILEYADDFKFFSNIDEGFAMVKRVAQRTNRLLSLPVAQLDSHPDAWRQIVALIEQANAEGVRIGAQALPRGTSMLYGLELSMHPFCLTPSYKEIHHLPLAKRVERMRDPEIRARIIADQGDPSVPLMSSIRKFDLMFEMTDPIDYEPSFDTSIAARAAALGVPAIELAYDILLSNEGRGLISSFHANYTFGNLDISLEMLRNEHISIGLGDAGAHLGVICDASYPTFLLTYWTRDRTRGGRLGLGEAIKKMTSDTAGLVGLHDRGVLAPGYRADVNVIDYDALTLHQPKIVHDLPAGGRRLTQLADGYSATIVNGKIVYSNGAPTGELPGKLVRGSRPAPAA